MKILRAPLALTLGAWSLMLVSGALFLLGTKYAQGFYLTPFAGNTLYHLTIWGAAVAILCTGAYLLTKVFKSKLSFSFVQVLGGTLVAGIGFILSFIIWLFMVIELSGFLGYGTFTTDGKEYVVVSRGDRHSFLDDSYTYDEYFLPISSVLMHSVSADEQSKVNDAYIKQHYGARIHLTPKK